MIKITLFFMLIFSFNSFAEKKKIQTSTCMTFDAKENLLKCSQLEKSSYFQNALFQSNCMKNPKNRFNTFGECPKQNVESSCIVPSGLYKVKSSDFYYYKIKNLKKLRHLCIQDFRYWNNIQEDENLKKILKENKVQMTSCLKFRDFKLVSCEEQNVLNFDAFKKQYYDCQLSMWDKTYYQFYYNKPCPKENTLTQCKLEHAEVAKNEIYYKTYDRASKDELDKSCYEKVKEFKEIAAKKPQVKKISCSLFDQDKLILCRDSDIKKGAFHNVLASCMQFQTSIQEKLEIEYDKSCSHENVHFECKIGEHKYFLHTKDERIKKRFEKLCE